MNGDFALLERWGSMLREQPSLPLPHLMDRPLLDYIGKSARLRVALLAKYLSENEPLLRAGAIVTAEAGQYQKQAAALDPDAT